MTEPDEPSLVGRFREIRLPSPVSAWRRRTFPWRPPPTPTGVEPATGEPALGVDYRNEWARNYPARVARATLSETLMRGVVGALASPEIRGLDRLVGLDEGAPAIFVSNHHSHADTMILSRAIPEPWRHHLVVGAAADYFFRHRAVAAASSLVLNTIPIERTRISRRSADHAEALLTEGWSLLLFPEGGRSPDGWGQPFRPGAAWLSLRRSAPVVPIHIEGSGRVLPKGAKRPHRSPVIVNFGRPLQARSDEDRHAFAARVAAAVAELGDESTSDWWTARRRAAAGSTPALAGPDGPGWRRAWALPHHRDERKRPWPKLGR